MRAIAATTLDRRRKTKVGYPLKLRITHDKSNNYISLKLYMTDEEYETYSTKKRLPQNLKTIKQKLVQAEAKAIKLLNNMEEYNFQKFKDQYLGVKPKEVKKVVLSDLFQQRIDFFKKKEKFNTSISYNSTLQAINRFRKGIKIQEVDYKLLEDFQTFLLSENKSITTVSIYMRAFKAVVNANKELFKIHPFKKYKIPQARNNKRAISEDSIKKVLSHQFNIEVFNFYLDLYRFSFYSGGINVKDMVLLKKTNVHGDYLIYHRAKTNRPIKIYLLPQAKEIIDKYADTKGFIFPILDNEEAEHIYKKVNSLTIKINYTLERVCEELKIPKITTYSARHSFATVLMNKGVSIAFISKALGHSNTIITENYLDSFTNDQMKEDMMKLI